MTRPRFSSQEAERLLVGVETAPGSGDFRVDDRLLVEEVRQRSDQAISSARIAVRLDDDFDAEAARRAYHPDLRIVVATGDETWAEREVLFEGYPPVQSWRWDGRIEKEAEQYTFLGEHVFERSSRSRKAQIFGRRVRSGAIEDGLATAPELYADRSVLTTALPCVFNADGRGNRAETPMTVAGPGGEPRHVHLFTGDGGGAEAWSFGSALRYLVWFYLQKEGPVFAGNVYDVTEPTPGPAAPSALVAALRRRPVSLNCEATNLVEALALLCDAAGIHVTAETANAAGRFETRLSVWSPEDGPVRQLHLARGGRYADGVRRYDPAGRSVSEVLGANNTYRGEVTWDHRGIVNHAVVIGGVKRFEMTLPLWPGWAPTSNLDDVAPGNRASAKALALTPADVTALGDLAESSDWFRKYHRQGSEYKFHSSVSRLWALNEDGRYEASVYNRNAPFDDYAPFDFSTVAGASVTRPGAWMRRARRLMPPISTSAEGKPLGVWVEVSFDSGTTWQQQAGGVRVLEDQAGIFLDVENPTELTPSGTDSAQQNMWYALIDQTFRVRVTAVVEGDDRLVATFGPAGLASPTLQTNAIVVRDPGSFQFSSQSDTTSVLAEVAPDAEVGRDDSAAIQAFAGDLGRANQDRQVNVAPTIPWLETRYQLGDRISEIRGRHIRFATTVGAGTRWPAVLERRFLLREGRYETELALGITQIHA